MKATDAPDVRDLTRCWEAMEARLSEANRLDSEGNHAAADRIGDELEAAYGRPLRDIARDHARHCRGAV